MDEWSDDDAPSWRRVHGIGRQFQPTAAGRRGFGVVLLLVVLLSALVGCTQGAPPVRWAELESTAEGFPVPQDFVAEKPTRNGRNCGKLEAECEDPRVNMTVTLAEGQPAVSELEACELLKDSIDRWAKSGLRDVEFEKDFGCTYFGMVGSYKVSAYVGDEQGQPVRTFVVVAFGKSR